MKWTAPVEMMDLLLAECCDLTLWRPLSLSVCTWYDQGLGTKKPTCFLKNVLPILRRSFSRFSAAERRQMGSLVRKPLQQESETHSLDLQRVQEVLPLLAHLYQGAAK